MSSASASSVFESGVRKDPKAPTNACSLFGPEMANPVPTDFCTLSDGSLVELVSSGDPTGRKMKLLFWNPEKVYTVYGTIRDGRFLVPPVLDEKLSTSFNLRLPTGVKACPAPGDFFLELCELIRTYIDLPESSVVLAAGFVLSTWFVDKLAVAPYLWICGPLGSGKTTLLRLLHCLCRRPVLVAGNGSQISPLPALLRPTLLFDELQFNSSRQSQALERWLRAGNAPGVPSTMGGRLVDGFGAKVLCSRQPGVDSALASRALHISMIPTAKNLQVLDEAAAECVANDFQNRLLMFRLQHYRKVVPATIKMSLISPRVRDLASALLTPFTDSESNLTAILAAINEQGAQAVAERTLEPEALVINALRDFCHDKNFSQLLVGEIAFHVNEARQELGEEADLKPRAIGPILRSLGLGTDKLSSFGRGIRLTAPVKRRIHQLVHIYNLQPSRIDGCILCQEFSPAAAPQPSQGQAPTVNK